MPGMDDLDRLKLARAKFEAAASLTSDKDEITLPGMGVFFEILWLNSNEKEKNKIISIIKKGLK